MQKREARKGVVLMAQGMIKRYWRYVRYIFQWLFMEKLRGLDFTMRDKTLLYEGGGLHGYGKTDDAHARTLFESIKNDDTQHIIDIGCGKGVVLREACRKSFGRIAGLEYDDRLVEIATRNFQRLGLLNRVEIYQGDARDFEHYEEFNVFYFANPFDAEIFNTVMKKIVDTQKYDVIEIIYYHPSEAHKGVVYKYGGKLVERLYDNVRDYETLIYKLEKC